jgi:hypothetical protein
VFLSLLRYGNNVKMTMGMNQNMFVFLSEGTARFQRCAPCISIGQLCVFAYGITIEDTTQAPMRCYTPTLGRTEKGSCASERSCDLRFQRFRRHGP